MKSLKTLINEAFNDKTKINQMGELQTNRYLKKDRKVKKILGGRSLYWDDVDLIIGNDVVISVKGDGEETMGDLKKAIYKAKLSPIPRDKSKAAAPGETKVGKFNIKLPTEIGGSYGGDAHKLDKPRAVLKTDVNSAKEIQKAVKGKGVKFRMMKRKDHVAVYLDFDDGKLMQAALKKLERIK
tara:strand:+ start:431 stop:979 length:549 start_codon:yes stop_codon:yes gene_type:complete